MKCCKCKRDARAQHNGYDWMCKWHYNSLIKQLRIQRKLDKANNRMASSNDGLEANLCPTCRQDMQEMPKSGFMGRDCPQCGQGLQWRLWQRVKHNRVKIAKAGL